MCIWDGVGCLFVELKLGMGNGIFDGVLNVHIM